MVRISRYRLCFERMMMMKKLIKVTVLSLAMATTGLSAQATMPTPPPPQVNKEAQVPTGQFDQKAREMEEKYNKLTSEQKAELAQLTEAVKDKQLELLNKYVEFGLVSQQDATAIENAMNQGIGPFN